MRRQTITWLLVGQAAASTAWWVVLVVVPASRPYFGDANVMAFWLPDAAVIATTLAAAFAVARGLAWAGAALWLVAGAMGYAALYCIVQGSALAITLMLTSAALAVVLARSGART